MPIHQIATWFSKAIPEPAEKNFTTQTGVHFEEVSEMIESLEGLDAHSRAVFDQAATALNALADGLKSGTVTAAVKDPVELLDALCDQVVTATGVAHMTGLDMEAGLKEVADSNDSKFDAAGQPIFNEDMKIMKGPSYFRANLAPHAEGATFILEAT